MLVRDATDADAEAGCIVLRRSITELCSDDHRNDPAVLQAWLTNKTPACVRAWIANPGVSLMVAVEADAILGVGGVTTAGRITLNYVSPDARFRGVSRTMVAALEARSAAWGITRIVLESTATARRFYLANGYVETGPPIGEYGMTSAYPMAKSLAQPRV